MPTTIPDLRCDRCRHNWRDHGLQGCLVSKVRWDNEAQCYVKIEQCGCKYYVGELPPLDVAPRCPHEVPDHAEDKSLRRTCVHCGVTVPPKRK